MPYLKTDSTNPMMPFQLQQMKQNNLNCWEHTFSSLLRPKDAYSYYLKKKICKFFIFSNKQLSTFVVFFFPIIVSADNNFVEQIVCMCIVPLQTWSISFDM